MKYEIIPNTNIEVSKICLGSMTWGEQNTEEEGHEQLDYALDQGINFIDTAEMYSVPGNIETQGSTERIIGTWLKKSGKRNDVVLASKVTGPNPGLSYIRNGPKFNREHIREAIEGNLSRLQVEMIDIYQLHWPERKANYFGKLDYNHDSSDEWSDNIQEIIGILDELIKEGKIRHYGISNETAWGLMHYVRTAEINKLPKPLTIQNPYSLLNRSYEIGLAEPSIRENVKLLAYSPLAFGMLSGKYLGGEKPEDARLSLFPQFSRYSNDQAMKATEMYKKVADKYNVSLVKLALAFVNTRPFVLSNIIGATKMEQLKENIESIDVDITEDMMKDLNEVHHQFSHPAP